MADPPHGRPFTNIETLLLAVLAVLTFRFLFESSGGPTISWDDLAYLQASLNADTGRGYNRYFHIYLQRVFVLIAGDTLSGGRLFWSFVITGTALLIYVLPRLIIPRISRFAGVFGLLFFFSSGTLFSRHSGVTFADTTCMAMVLLGVLVYVLSERAKSERSYRYLFLLGAVAFLAFKTKETGIVVSVLAFAALVEAFRSGPAAMLRRGIALLAGFGAALLAMMIVDYLYLGDFLFQFRLEKITSWLDGNIGNYRPRGRRGNWLEFLASSTYVLPFLLYLLCPGVVGRDRPGFFSIVCMTPLVVLVFLTLTAISGNWSVVQRYFYPAWPIISMFAGVSLAAVVRGPGTTLRVVGGLFAGLVVAYYLARYGEQGARAFGWDSGWKFHESIVYPVAVMTLLVAAVAFPRTRLSALVILCAFVVSIYLPAKSKIYAIADGSVKKRGLHRFEPLSRFHEHLRNMDEKTLFISSAVHTDHGLLGRDPRSTRYIIDIWFNRRMNLKQVVFHDDPLPLGEQEFDFAFVTRKDLARLEREPEILEKYDSLQDPESRYVLLCLPRHCRP